MQLMTAIRLRNSNCLGSCLESRFAPRFPGINIGDDSDRADVCIGLRLPPSDAIVFIKNSVSFGPCNGVLSMLNSDSSPYSSSGKSEDNNLLTSKLKPPWLHISSITMSLPSGIDSSKMSGAGLWVDPKPLSGDDMMMSFVNKMLATESFSIDSEGFWSPTPALKTQLVHIWSSACGAWPRYSWLYVE